MITLLSAILTLLLADGARAEQPTREITARAGVAGVGSLGALPSTLRFSQEIAVDRRKRWGGPSYALVLREEVPGGPSDFGLSASFKTSWRILLSPGSSLAPFASLGYQGFYSPSFSGHFGLAQIGVVGTVWQSRRLGFWIQSPAVEFVFKEFLLYTRVAFSVGVVVRFGSSARAGGPRG